MNRPLSGAPGERVAGEVRALQEAPADELVGRRPREGVVREVKHAQALKAVQVGGQGSGERVVAQGENLETCEPRETVW